MTIQRNPTIPRYSLFQHPKNHSWFVTDRDHGLEPVAGPYETEVQAVYVAYWLAENPMSVPFAPDPMGDVREVLKRWHR